MAYLPAVIIAAGIAVVSLWENPQVPQAFQASDKLIHGLMYALLSIAMVIPDARHSRTRALPYIYVCLTTTFYGLLIEALQRFCTLSRTGTMDDLIADFIGALIGVLLIFVITRSRDHVTSKKS